MKRLFVYLLVFSFACESKKEISKDCPSLNLSQNQKSDNNLFLDFYYGMNEREFKSVVDSLVNKGTLEKDSLIKFRVDFPVIPNKDEFVEINSHFYFSLSPVFNNCKLYKLILSHLYIPSDAVLDTEYARYPDEFDTKRIEKIYKSKYGKPFIENEKSFPYLIERNFWKLRNKKIEICNIYTPTESYSTITGKKMKTNPLTGFYIEYTNVIEENKKNRIKDSTSLNKQHEQNNKASNSMKHL